MQTQSQRTIAQAASALSSPEHAALATESDVDYSVGKIIAFSIAAAISASAFGYFVARGDSLASLAAGTLLIALLILQVLFVKDFSRNAVTLFVQVVILAGSALLARAELTFPIVGSVGLLLYILLLLALIAGRREAAESLRVRFFSLARAVFGTAATGLALFSVVIVGATVTAEELTSKTVFGYVAQPLGAALRYYDPALSLNMRTETVLKRLAATSLKDDEKTSALVSELPEEARDRVLSEAAIRLARSVEAYTGAAIDISLSFRDALYGLFKTKVDAWIGGYSDLYVSIIVASLLFIAIKSASIFLYWIVAIVAFLIYELLLVTGFAEVSLETRSKEIVLLK